MGVNIGRGMELDNFQVIRSFGAKRNNPARGHRRVLLKTPDTVKPNVFCFFEKKNFVCF